MSPEFRVSIWDMLDYWMIHRAALLPIKMCCEPVCGRININFNSNNNRAD